MFTDLHTMANAELSALAVAVSIEAARIRADEAAVEYEFQRRTSEARLVEPQRASIPYPSESQRRRGMIVLTLPC